jgi:3-hydroxybutyryl-CoA dehydrogenase
VSGTATGISRVGVIGSGLMGSGIAEGSARGLDVAVRDIDAAAAAAGRKRIEASLERGSRRAG